MLEDGRALRIGLLVLLWFPRGLAGAPRDECSQAHADKGLQLIQEGNLKGAEAELRQAVQLDPENAAHVGSLGAVLGMEKRIEESNVYLQKALRINPADWKTRRNLASNQFQLGQLQLAKENLEKVLKAAPRDDTTRLLLGMVAEESKDYAAAVKWLALVPDQVRRRPESIVALARSYYNIGQKEKARQILNDLVTLGRAERRSALGPAPLALTSDWQEGLFLGGQAAARARDYEAAQQMFASISATYPDPAKLGYNLALAQYYAGYLQRSEATLNHLVSAGQETADIDNLIGWCLFKRGKFREAVESLDKAINLDPSSETNYLDVGLMLLEQRRYQGAFAAALKAIEVAPESYRAWRLKGVAEANLDRIKEAEESYQRAVELNPSDEQSMLGLASEQLNNGKIDEAKHTFEKGIQRLPRDAAIYQAYGKVLLWLQGAGASSDEARAVSMLQTALGLDPSLAEPHYQLGKLALRKGQIAGALQELEAAKRLGPKSSQTHYQLALVYRKVGRAEDAARELQAFKTLKGEENQPALGKPVGGSVATLTEETRGLEGPSPNP